MNKEKGKASEGANPSQTKVGTTGRSHQASENRSTQKLLHLDPLQPLNTSPHSLANSNGQFPAFQPLIDKPQSHDELLLVQRGLSWRRRLSWLAGDDKIPDCFEFAFGKAGAHPEVADDHVGDIVG